jgi:hypothetical protein
MEEGAEGGSGSGDNCDVYFDLRPEEDLKG